MDIKVNLTRKDYIAFSHYTWKRLRRQPGFKGIATVLNILFWVLVGLFGTAIASVYRSNEGMVMVDLDYALIILAILAVYGYLYTHLLGRYALRRSVADGGNTIGEFTYTFMQDSIRETCQHSETRYSWQALQCFVETDDHVFIYTDNARGMFIPKHEVDKSQLDQLLRFFAEKAIPEG